MNTYNKTSAPGAGALISIPFSDLVSRDDLKVRGGHLSEQHVHELRQAIRRGSKLPPVLVWQEPEQEGTSSGRFVLLDGRHRLAALREERRGLSSIKAEVFHGTRQEALLAAAGRNTKTALPLTRWQATNAAWAVVRMDREPYSISKAQIARECGVSTGTLASMRARWKTWSDELEPTGDWQRDKRDRQGGEEPMDEEEYMRQRAEMIEQTAKRIRTAVGRLPEADFQAFAEAVELVAGWRTAELVDYLSGGDEDEDEEEQDEYGPPKEPRVCILEGEELPF